MKREEKRSWMLSVEVEDCLLEVSRLQWQNSAKLQNFFPPPAKSLGQTHIILIPANQTPR